MLHGGVCRRECCAVLHWSYNQGRGAGCVLRSGGGLEWGCQSPLLLSYCKRAAQSLQTGLAIALRALSSLAGVALSILRLQSHERACEGRGSAQLLCTKAAKHLDPVRDEYQHINPKGSQIHCSLFAACILHALNFGWPVIARLSIASQNSTNLWKVCRAASDEVLPGAGHQPSPPAQEVHACPSALLSRTADRVPQHGRVKVAQRHSQLRTCDGRLYIRNPALALRYSGRLLRIHQAWDGLPAAPAQQHRCAAQPDTSSQYVVVDDVGMGQCHDYAHEHCAASAIRCAHNLSLEDNPASGVKPGLNHNEALLMIGDNASDEIPQSKQQVHSLARGLLGEGLREAVAAAEARPEALIVDHPVRRLLGGLVLDHPAVALEVVLHEVVRLLLWHGRTRLVGSAACCAGLHVQQAGLLVVYLSTLPCASPSAYKSQCI